MCMSHTPTVLWGCETCTYSPVGCHCSRRHAADFRGCMTSQCSVCLQTVRYKLDHPVSTLLVGVTHPPTHPPNPNPPTHPGIECGVHCWSDWPPSCSDDSGGQDRTALTVPHPCPVCPDSLPRPPRVHHLWCVLLHHRRSRVGCQTMLDRGETG